MPTRASADARLGSGYAARVLELRSSRALGWSKGKAPAVVVGRLLGARVAIAILLVAGAWDATVARADGLEVYAPLEQEPVWALDVHASAIFPIERGAVCPAGASCVLGGGFGAGAYLLRRSPDGVGLLVGYEVWFFNGGGVYEVGALHSLRLGVRWTLDNRSIVQPLLQATVGAVLLTDPAQASTAGGLVGAGTGLEIEVTRDVALSLTAELAFFSVAAFRTRDGADRAADFGVNVALETSAGLVVVLGSSGVR